MDSAVAPVVRLPFMVDRLSGCVAKMEERRMIGSDDDRGSEFR